MIKAVIFDCFGVVISDALEVVCRELREHDADAADQVRSIIHASNRGITDPGKSSRQVAEILGLSYEQYRTRIAEGEVKDLELLSYVTSLRGSYKTALLSNIGAGSLSRRFEQDELAEYFDVVVASGDIGYAKPEPESYEIVADRLGVRLDECVFTDDREPYCTGARAVGMHALLYTDFPQFKHDLERLLANTK